MAAVGNLNDYVKFQLAQGLEHGGTGVAGIGAEMAVGLALTR
jgi:membrane protease subunit (stomatin/prohibitin family)